MAAEDIQPGQEVVEGYQADADTAELLASWGFLEQGNPNDWPYPIQRPLQLLPRLPWDVVLAAAGRLFECIGCSPEQLVDQQQQQLPWTAEALAALQDGRGAVRVLTAAASLPVVADGTLASLDSSAAEEAKQLDVFLYHWMGEEERELGLAGYQELPLQLQRPLWSQPARSHIMQRVVDGAGGAGGQAVAAALVMADSPQQRWEATLAALTATLLGLHARVGLLSMPTTTGEDLELLAAPGGQAAAAAATGGSGQVQQGKRKVLQLLQKELQACTRALAEVAAGQAKSSSSGDGAGRGEELMGVAQQVQRLMDLVDRAQQVESERERQQQQRLASSPPSTTAGQAAGARDAVSVLAVEARLEQKLLLHVYSLLCDAIMLELNTVLAEGGQEAGLS
jgi:hypothetical protein